MAMMAITTSSSISVNAGRRERMDALLRKNAGRSERAGRSGYEARRARSPGTVPTRKLSSPACNRYLKLRFNLISMRVS